ncbi:MAG: penicillin-binding protein 2 [Coriobacteriia bacterium]|nr:penicillin-binding protein 2 [Coriobacteriia bacterium]
MIAAIVLGILAAVAVIAVIVAVFIMRTSADGRVTSNKDTSFTSIDTVVNAAAPTVENQMAGAAVQDSAQNPSGKPAESLSQRFAAVGIFGALTFAVLGVKAFVMQVLNSSSYSSESANNQYTTVYTPAPRGGIFDTGGMQLVRNRSSLTVLAEADVADDPDVVARLSGLLGVPRTIIRQRISDASGGAQAQRVVASDARRRDLAFIAEHSDAFSGVSIETRTVRQYPYGALAAHALGYAGTVSETDLQTIPEGRNIQFSDDIGKSGVEATYDALLAGEHGQRVVVADANGNIREVVSEVQPTKGSDVYLTIAAPVQYVADTLLQQCIAPTDNTIGTGKGTTGAAVVMNVKTGDIVAMASYPTFTPESFVGGINQDDWDLYNTDESYYPLLNRAIAGAYPAASTYKAFTALAGLRYGFATDESTWNCSGSWDGFGSGDWQDCWNLYGHGTLNLHWGIVNSCDVVFYEIAKDFFYAGKSYGGTISDTAMQEEIAKFNFGKLTGIDLEGEVAGRVPTPEWKASYFKDVPEEASWLGGDMSNMVIGQGYVLITPLQLAVAYGGVATGKLMKPHLLKEVRNSKGDVVVSYQPEELGQPDVKPEHYKTVRNALHSVGQENTLLAGLFGGWGLDAACKTGTAEVAGKGDTAWFVCYAPFDDPKFVCSVVVEQGGSGGETASPLGVDILAAAVNYDKGELTDVGYVMASSGHSVEYRASSDARTD